MIHPHTAAFVKEEAVARFLRYVKVNTRSDDASQSFPSTSGQLDLARMIASEMAALGIRDVTLDPHGYLYAALPHSQGVSGPAVTFCAHLDTSPSESGEGVQPVLHEDYDGGAIRFPDAPELLLSPETCPQLETFVGETLITASGTTLLGADDKAGLAEIVTALAALKRFPELPHPELRIVLTPDEEIGRGTERIDLQRLGVYGYTMDGGMMGELEAECFDAFQILLTFHGRNIHPGYAKGKMINAAAVAARFVAALPEAQTPEHTENREGFWHVTELGGKENQARAKLILRDFESESNQARVRLVEQFARTFELRYPGLGIDLETKEQYRNMREVLHKHPEVLSKARRAIEEAGLAVIHRPIRGGTDGARLSFMGMPCPNLFAGGVHFHSRTEWVPVIALQKATEVILHLCRLWA